MFDFISEFKKKTPKTGFPLPNIRVTFALISSLSAVQLQWSRLPTEIKQDLTLTSVTKFAV